MREFVIECVHCENSSSAVVVGEIEDRDYGHGPPSLIELLRCSQCGQATLMVREDFGNGWDSPYRLWPAQRRPLSLTIPKALRDQHDEARKCFEVRAFTATVVMVRRTLEGVCFDKGIKGRPLVQLLRTMLEKEFIDARLFEWAQELRMLGNEGAHFTGRQVAKEDATEALDFCEALLDYTYVLTQKFSEFKARRAQENVGE